MAQNHAVLYNSREAENSELEIDCFFEGLAVICWPPTILSFIYHSSGRSSSFFPGLLFSVTRVLSTIRFQFVFQAAQSVELLHDPFEHAASSFHTQLWSLPKPVHSNCGIYLVLVVPLLILPNHFGVMILQ